MIHLRTIDPIKLALFVTVMALWLGGRTALTTPALSSEALSSTVRRGAIRSSADHKHQMGTDTERGQSLCECGDHVFIPMGGRFVLLISPQDASLLNEKWTLSLTSKGVPLVRRWFGPRETRKKKLIYRVITNAPEGMEVDHANRNVMDQRRANLRVCTHVQNEANKAGRSKRGLPKGVDIAKSGRFAARLRIDGKDTHLGTFDDAGAASEAYFAAAKRLYGEFARIA